MPSAAFRQIPMALGVILLGAGASSRMGRPKLLLPWGETSIVGHIIAQWRALAAQQIAIVCAPGDLQLQAELDLDGLPPQNRIENPEPARGMFSSILCAASWNGWEAGLTDWVIVLGDQPHLQPATLRALLEFRLGLRCCSPEVPSANCAGPKPERCGIFWTPVRVRGRRFRSQTAGWLLTWTGRRIMK